MNLPRQLKVKGGRCITENMKIHCKGTMGRSVREELTARRQRLAGGFIMVLVLERATCRTDNARLQ